jgi:hypothetical protein
LLPLPQIAVLHSRECFHKLRFLRAHGVGVPWDDHMGGAAVRYACLAVTVAVGSYAAAECAARWGGPYACPV